MLRGSRADLDEGQTVPAWRTPKDSISNGTYQRAADRSAATEYRSNP
jgi:hypothetical protein